ncbi:hypothetical protein EYF80_052115 [Liparis tanakae]|uniref:Uncharacterized protein n=1 Tax=Liparis tanakae TaxID=230148 RepID=A0A4Z2F963_9TELE|nr:hypothetical protein EYF80_052115 [Liparis tanakae]
MAEEYARTATLLLPCTSPLAPSGVHSPLLQLLVAPLLFPPRPRVLFCLEPLWSCSAWNRSGPVLPGTALVLPRPLVLFCLAPLVLPGSMASIRTAPLARERPSHHPGTIITNIITTTFPITKNLSPTGIRCLMRRTETQMRVSGTTIPITMVAPSTAALLTMPVNAIQ